MLKLKQQPQMMTAEQLEQELRDVRSEYEGASAASEDDRRTHERVVRCARASEEIEQGKGEST